VSEHAEARRQPQVLTRSEHSISRSLISENALKVLYRLRRSGFTSYLVGGAVRDLMLGRRPKDFDVGTNARPQQVRQLFRNARLIGRRFRLARVIFTGEVVEVATFRRSPDPPEMLDGETNDALAPTPEDNEFGTPDEDARRRDFTVNALFYSIADFTVIDFVGGLADLDERIIRSVGPARIRFGEDPVRMMRAVEYAARLGFRLEEEAAEAISGMHGEIRRAAAARIAYELLESLRSGQAEAIFRGLEEHGLLRHVLPEVHEALRRPQGALLWRLLERADRAAGQGKAGGDDALLATLLLPGSVEIVEAAAGGNLAPTEVEEQLRQALGPATTRLALSNYLAHVLRNAFTCLARIVQPPRAGKQVARTMRQEGFPAALGLAAALVDATGRYRESVVAWQGAVARAQAGLPALPDARGEGGKRRRRGRRRHRGMTSARPGQGTS